MCLMSQLQNRKRKDLINRQVFNATNYYTVSVCTGEIHTKYSHESRILGRKLTAV